MQAFFLSESFALSGGTEDPFDLSEDLTACNAVTKTVHYPFIRKTLLILNLTGKGNKSTQLFGG